MIVGIPKEVKDNEYRIAATPEGVRELVDAGHTVLIEEGAGLGSSLSEERYKRSGAQFVSSRRAGDDNLEVVFRFRGERFITVVHAATLQVIDAGICLVDYEDGHRGDSDLTLESLPSAIREARELDALVVTRR